MKLIAEQVRYLREKKQELLRKRNEYANYCKNRESIASDWIGSSPMIDIQEDTHMSRALGELHQIDEMLSHSDIIVDRKLDQVDVGTRFSVIFEDNEKEDIILTEPNSLTSNCGFVSLESELGKAVVGHKKGDKISYTVKSTGRKLTATIDDIDTMREHYDHFLCETPYSHRGSSAQRRNLTKLNRQGANDSNQITESQAELIKEEIRRLGHGPKTTSNNTKRALLKKVLNSSPIAKPEGDTIGIGSQVQLLLLDGDEEFDKSFEFINRAYTTELEAHYVERSSALGNAIYGLKEGDSFKVNRMKGNPYTGVVLTVVNQKERERVY